MFSMEHMFVFRRGLGGYYNSLSLSLALGPICIAVIQIEHFFGIFIRLFNEMRALSRRRWLVARAGALAQGPHSVGNTNCHR